MRALRIFAIALAILAPSALKGHAMARQFRGNTITVESAAALTLNYAVNIATSGLFAHTAAGDLPVGVVVELGGETAAPYTATVQIDGVVQMASDGAGAIDEKDWLEVGATDGTVVKRALTDGTTLRYFVGQALTPAAATLGLLVDVLLRPHIRGGA